MDFLYHHFPNKKMQRYFDDSATSSVKRDVNNVKYP